LTNIDIILLNILPFTVYLYGLHTKEQKSLVFCNYKYNKTFLKNNKKPIQHSPQNKRPSKKQTAQSGNILKTREFLLENPE